MRQTEFYAAYSFVRQSKNNKPSEWCSLIMPMYPEAFSCWMKRKLSFDQNGLVNMLTKITNKDLYKSAKNILRVTLQTRKNLNPVNLPG